VLETRAEFATRFEQTATVNSQLIVRSELLALPYLDLCERIRQEADENPALELEVSSLGPEVPTRMAETWARGGRDAEGWQDPTLRAPAEYTLRDELRRLAACETDGQQRRIIEYLIETVDERGWLATTELDASFELGVSEEQVREAVAVLQQIAPPGVGARNLRECLLLQLDAVDDEPPHVRAVLTCCGEALGPSGWARVAASLSLSESDVAEALAFIREHLNPYPGEQFRPEWSEILPESPMATEPDAIVTMDGEELEVTLTTTRTISLRLGEAYRRLDDNMRALNQRAGDEATTRARAQARAARQLVWSLQQRERSLYRITCEIVRAQREFIIEGPLFLRPLTHKQISEITGLHESTISRAVSGKLVMLPSGECVSYSVFFDDALPARTVIKGLIADEAPDTPLTDERLQTLMAERGFELARRTVNKYRHALGIPSAARRKAARAVA
jgi:RNA polymerase sigma-54 factor